MSRKVSFLEKLGLNSDTMSSLLPQYNSPPRRSSYDHDLEELEPRPDDSLLYTDYDSPKMPSRTQSTDSNMLSGSPRSPATATSKGKGKAVAIAYQGRPGSWHQQNRKPSFIPPIPPDLTERRAPEFYLETVSEPASEASFIDTILPRRTRPNEMPNNLRIQVDDTFKEIARRERQMQRELQRLLDAQAAAIEQKLSGGKEKKEDSESRASTPNHKSRSQSVSYTSDSSRREKTKNKKSSSRQHIIPVRQPPERRLTLGQTRAHIIRVMRNLADLKEEEDAYIATAVAERKAGLSKLGTLKTRHQQIKHDIQEIENDPGDPLTNDIQTIERDLHTASAQIEEYRRLLRRAEQTKAALERRLEEAKSEAESRLSGYKGALRECEAGIRDLVRRPNVRVLELEQDDAEDEEGEEDGATTAEQRQQQQQQQNYITGFEFFKLRPERRTLPMARDWWEGEVVALERRRGTVDKERAALEEGEAIWAEVIDTIQRHEEQLTGALGSNNNSGSNSSGDSSPPLQRNNGPSAPSPLARGSVSSATTTATASGPNPEDVIRNQWYHLVDVIRKLERAHAYAEERGWTLLVAAVGAEISVYYDAREMVRTMLRGMGLEPPPPTPPPIRERRSVPSGMPGYDLVDMRDGGSGGGGVGLGVGGDALMREELSGSVIRRWEDPDENSRQQQQQQQQKQQKQQQSGDYHQLQQEPQTDQQQQYKDNPILLSSSPPAGPPSDLLIGGERERSIPDTTDNEHEDDDNNEVPAGLLNEAVAAAHRGGDESEDEHHHTNNNEVPPEFLSLHGGGGDGHASSPFFREEEEDEEGKELKGSGSGHQRRLQLRQKRGGSVESADHDDDDDDDEHGNENQVPLDLLSERRPGYDDDDDGNEGVD